MNFAEIKEDIFQLADEIYESLLEASSGLSMQRLVHDAEKESFTRDNVKDAIAILQHQGKISVVKNTIYARQATQEEQSAGEIVEKVERDLALLRATNEDKYREYLLRLGEMLSKEGTWLTEQLNVRFLQDAQAQLYKKLFVEAEQVYRKFHPTEPGKILKLKDNKDFQDFAIKYANQRAAGATMEAVISAFMRATEKGSRGAFVFARKEHGGVRAQDASAVADTMQVLLDRVDIPKRIQQLEERGLENRPTEDQPYGKLTRQLATDYKISREMAQRLYDEYIKNKLRARDAEKESIDRTFHPDPRILAIITGPKEWKHWPSVFGKHAPRPNIIREINKRSYIGRKHYEALARQIRLSTRVD